MGPCHLLLEAQHLLVPLQFHRDGHALNGDDLDAVHHLPYPHILTIDHGGGVGAPVVDALEFERSLKINKKNDLEKMGMFPLRLRYGPVVVR